MRLGKKEIYTLNLDTSELDILIRGVSQRLQGWADRKIQDYEERMLGDTEPQHYITGYQEYCRFEQEFKDEFKVLETLIGRWYIDTRDRNAQELIRSRDLWIERFKDVQKAYDAKKAT